MTALRPAHRCHVGFHHRGHHLQPGAHRQRQQALLHLAGQLGQRHAHRFRHGGRTRLDLALLVLVLHGSPLPRGVLGGSPEYLPHGRIQAGDRRLNFHETRDNLLEPPQLACLHQPPHLVCSSEAFGLSNLYGRVLGRGRWGRAGCANPVIGFAGTVALSDRCTRSAPLAHLEALWRPSGARLS
jgi:hypothetical protein